MEDRRPAHRPTIAAFVSSHGYGHAARAAAVLGATRRILPTARFELFTATPTWFFEGSLGRRGTDWEIHPEAVDLGLVQTDALREDPEATVAELDAAWLEAAEPRVDATARTLRELGVAAVLCDISPFGLRAAHRAAVPSLLVESFTWDWIYAGYRSTCPELAERGRRLATDPDLATVRLRTEPFCGPRNGLPSVGPIARPVRADRRAVRRALGLEDSGPLVLVTMGGIEWTRDPWERASASGSTQNPWIVWMGGTDRVERRGRILRLPHRSPIHHPDLVAAADAVIAKLGYSTLAEIHRTGAPLGYVPRPGFPESPVLESWARQRLSCVPISPRDLRTGHWIGAVPELLQRSRATPPEDPDRPAREAAERLIELLA